MIQCIFTLVAEFLSISVNCLQQKYTKKIKKWMHEYMDINNANRSGYFLGGFKQRIKNDKISIPNKEM